MKYDFGGWATRNDLQCADGRVIKKDAFKGQNGQTVPLVWMHNHADPANVLGLAHLENRDEGVYAFCEFNDTDSGKTARELVKHGDVQSLSIFANQLKQAGHDVVHGIIREVSLVLAGANPGAFIDDVVMHGDGETGIILGYDEMIMGQLEHSADEPDEKQEEKGGSNDEPDNEEKKDEKDGKGKYVRRERYTGTCNRSFYIGKSIKHEDIHAKYDNGILHLTFPKEETKKEVEEKKFIAID